MKLFKLIKNGNYIKQNQVSFTIDLTKGFYTLVSNIQYIIDVLKNTGCFLNDERKKNIETQFQLKVSSHGIFMYKLHYF